MSDPSFADTNPGSRPTGRRTTGNRTSSKAGQPASDASTVIPPHQTTSQIHDELLAEVQDELRRRGTSVVKPKAAPDDVAGFAAGGILACLALLAGTGVAMALGYSPSADDANASVVWFTATGVGAFVRNAHWHGANLLVLLCMAYVALLLWRGLHRRPGHGRFWRGAALLGLAVGFSLTGQLLPYDQLAVHGTAIRLGYLAEAPLVGEALRGALQGGDSIGSASLSRFFAMHVIVLPALCALLLRWLWRDSRVQARQPVHYGVAAAVVLLVCGVALVWHAPLGLQGDLSQPYPAARPEWFALSLYGVLKLLPPGIMQALALFVPPLLAVIAVGALPWLDSTASMPWRRMRLVRLAVIVGAVLFTGLSVLPVIEDFSGKRGWFAADNVPDLMAQMGTRNDALLHSGEAAPAHAHVLARDLELLHRRLIGVYPEKIDAEGKTRWDEFARKGEAASIELRLAADSIGQAAARAKLRDACFGCHKLHEKGDIPLDPPARFSAPVAAKGPFFDPVHLAEVTATAPSSKTTKRVMDFGRFGLEGILVHAGVIEGETKHSPERNWRNLEASVDLIAGVYEANAGSYDPDKGQQQWTEWVAALKKAVSELGQAKSPEEVADRAKAVGKACETCHDAAMDLDEPIEWTYAGMLGGSKK